MKTPEQNLAVRSRRAFLTMGAAAAAGYGGWTWLRSKATDGDLPTPFRKVLETNERIAKAYFDDRHSMPEFPQSAVNPDTRVNGDIGLGPGFEPSKWKLSVERRESPPIQLSLADIQALPRIEQTTQLNCIEGWTVVVHWTGVRFRDFTAKYAPESVNGSSDRYVQMYTPDEEYYVGLDAASALHPQTLLCFEMNGEALTSEHGAPLRLVIPVKYGVKNLKRIGRIIYSNKRPMDYWANQGYDWYAGL